MIGRADGSVEVLTVRNDLPLGLIHTLARHEHTVELLPGDTLVLYTDGLVERRGQDLPDGISFLARALHGASAHPVREVVRSVLARTLPEPGEDDVAIVAVRAGAADEPAPS